MGVTSYSVLTALSISARQSTIGHHDSSRATEYYIVAAICTGLSVIVVALRLYIRLRLTRNPWWDDGAVIIALLAQAAYTGVVWRTGIIALGSHQYEVSLENLLTFGELATASAILTAPAIYFTKLTLLLLYLRLFSMNYVVKLGIWAGITVCSLFYTVVMFLYIFVGKAMQLKVTYAVAVVGVVSDVYIICLPLIAVAHLRLHRAKKWRVAAVFLTGLLAVVMSFLGCVYRFQLDTSNSTYSLLAIYTVNTVEVYIGIICSCLPLLAALFKKGEKESWWLSSFRSLRERLNGSHLGSGSNRSNRTHGSSGAEYTAYRKDIPASSEDNFELVQSKVTVESIAGSSSVTNPPANLRSEQGIWRQTHIQQQWTHYNEVV